MCVCVVLFVFLMRVLGTVLAERCWHSEDVAVLGCSSVVLAWNVCYRKCGVQAEPLSLKVRCGCWLWLDSNKVTDCTREQNFASLAGEVEINASTAKLIVVTNLLWKQVCYLWQKKCCRDHCKY